MKNEDVNSMTGINKVGASSNDSFSHKCYQVLSSSRFWAKSLGPRLGYSVGWWRYPQTTQWVQRHSHCQGSVGWMIYPQTTQWVHSHFYRQGSMGWGRYQQMTQWVQRHSHYQGSVGWEIYLQMTQWVQRHSHRQGSIYRFRGIPIDDTCGKIFSTTNKQQQQNYGTLSFRHVNLKQA